MLLCLNIQNARVVAETLEVRVFTLSLSLS